MRSTGAPGITRLVGNTPLLRVRMFEREFPRLEVYAKACLLYTSDAADE